MAEHKEWISRRPWSDEMVAGFSRLQRAGTSNFTIICDDQKWAVHRDVLILHSPAFVPAVTGPYTEAKEATLDLSDDREACVEAMVQYFYSGDYEIPGSSEEPSVVFHTQMAIVADKWDLSDLKKLATEKFHLCALKTESVIPDELARAADIAYEAPNATAHIRKTIVEIAALSQQMFTGRREGSAFEKVMRKHSDLSFAVAKCLREMFADGNPGEQRVTRMSIWNKVTAPTSIFAAGFGGPSRPQAGRRS